MNLTAYVISIIDYFWKSRIALSDIVAIVHVLSFKIVLIFIFNFKVNFKLKVNFLGRMFP